MPTYKTLYKDYEWFVPNHFNIADYCCHRWATNPHEARQVAIYFEDQVGQLTLYSHQKMSQTAQQLAQSFLHMGIKPQERIVVSMAHSAELAIAILACLSIGAVCVPLPSHLSSSEYQARFNDCKAKIAVVDNHAVGHVLSAINHHSSVKRVVGFRTQNEHVIEWNRLLARQTGRPQPACTDESTPAFLFYHDDLSADIVTHGALVGSLPGFVCAHNWFPKPQDTFFSDYCWDSPEGILYGLLPALYFGRPIVACPPGRTMPRLFNLLQHYQVTTMLLSPMELQRIHTHAQNLSEFSLALRCVSCPDNGQGDRAQRENLRTWVREQLGCDLNYFLSSPSTLMIAGDSAERWKTQEGALGHAYPGHRLAVLSSNLKPIRTGQNGELVAYKTDIHSHIDPAIVSLRWVGQQIVHDEQPFIRTGIKVKLGKDQTLL